MHDFQIQSQNSTQQRKTV